MCEIVKEGNKTLLHLLLFVITTFLIKSLSFVLKHSMIVLLTKVWLSFVLSWHLANKFGMLPFTLIWIASKLNKYRDREYRI